MKKYTNYILWIIIVVIFSITLFSIPSTPLKYKEIINTKPIVLLPDTVTPIFTDETIKQGIFKPHIQSSDHLSGIHESFGSGACVLDYNNDGWMDLFLINGSGLRRYYGEKEWWQSNTSFTLYKNTGLNSFEDVSSSAFNTELKGWGMGCSAADLDNDGNQDLIVSNYGDNFLLRNNGDETFSDITDHANFKGDEWSTSILTADFNNDGLLDIYITNYIKYKQSINTYESSSGYSDRVRKQFNAPLFDSSPNKLYINKGNLVFKDQTQKSGVKDASGKGIATEILDINNDGLMDIFVSNDQGGSNKLFINNNNLNFSDKSEFYKIASIQQTTGVKSADIDNDGFFDLILGTNNKNSKIYYKNNNNKILIDAAKKTGLDKTETSGAMTKGINLSDLNNDGRPDIFLANGFISPSNLSPLIPQGQPNLILINTPKGFDQCTTNCFLKNNNSSESSRSVVSADFDNDGDIDLYISQNNALGQLLSNKTPSQNWLGVKLVGDKSNKDAIGASVTITTDKNTYTKKINNSGFLSSQDRRILFHFRKENIESITIKWPSGLKENITNLPINQYIKIGEGKKSFTSYYSRKVQPPRSEIILSNKLHKIEVISWLSKYNKYNKANTEANTLLKTKLSTQELTKLINIANILHPEIALKIYMNGLQSNDNTLRVLSIKKLKGVEEEITSRFLLNLFYDPSPEIKCEVAKTYEHFFAEEEAMIRSKYLAIPDLIRLLNDTNIAVKNCAINALAESESHRATLPLMEIISSTTTNDETKIYAINALGRLRERKSKELLFTILHKSTESNKARYSALTALKRLNAINEHSFYIKNLNYYNEKGRLQEFLNILLDLMLDPKNNIIVNPNAIISSLEKFSKEKQNGIEKDTQKLINKIIYPQKLLSGNILKNNISTKKIQTYLSASLIKEKQKILSNISENFIKRTNILNDEKITKLFSTKQILEKISSNKNDPLYGEAIEFLIKNNDNKLSAYKKRMIDKNYDEDYRFYISKGLIHKDPDFVINNILVEE